MLVQLARLVEAVTIGVFAVARVAWQAFVEWRESRQRVWTVWHGIHPDGGHAVPIAIRKTEAAAKRMVDRAPKIRVAVDRRVLRTGPPPVDHVPQTWLIAQPVRGGTDG